MAWCHTAGILIAMTQFCIGQMLFEFLNFGSRISDTVEFAEEYDFIVIGSGSGGSVMANRLSENASWTVLLLEAGEEESRMVSDVPLTAASTILTRHNWGYRTEPTPNACLKLVDGVCNWPKGRTLGGTSVINYLLYHRGHQDDYNLWAKLGNSGWAFDDVLPYFRKSERVGIEELKNSKFRGTKGYLDVQHAPYTTELLKGFFEVAREMGYPQNDPNGEELLGFSQVQATMRNGRRRSAAKAYLTPIASQRPNLHIAMRSWVTKILIEPKTKVAYGVEFVKNRRKYKIRATKEVILSAGAIASPQLLMLSGVGPRKHLERHGIPVIQDLKVGYNLQDHLGASGLVFLVNQSITITESKVANPRNLVDFWLFGQGPFTSPGGAEGLAFLKVNNSKLAKNYPDIEVVLGAGALSGDISGTMRNMLGIPNKFFQTVFKDVMGHEAFALMPIILQPRSRGRISLKSTNPFHWPRMQPNYLQDPYDLETLLEGVKLAVRMGEMNGFRTYGSHLHKRPFFGCEHLSFGNDDYWRCCIQGYSSSLQHQVGTCKMGPETDPDAVVNPKLQVYGIRNLRVVDASIMPVLPAAHTNGVVFMIGEKAADLVKADWGGKEKLSK